PLHHAVVRDVAPQQIAAIAEPHRPLVPAHARRDSLDFGQPEAVAPEARVDDLDRRIRIALARLPLRKRARHRRQRGDARPCLKELPFAPFHGSPFVEQRILVIRATSISALGGGFNRSTQRLLILPDEEVSVWRGTHRRGTRRSRGLTL